MHPAATIVFEVLEPEVDENVCLFLLSHREVSEPSAAAVTEEEPDSESAMALPPASGAEPENSEGPVEEVRSLRGCSGL